ncbi:hypothetical protein [Saccharopolyspora phatthalungensis]|uniref:Uncharacterized protein n=1 Tax=Saccharopolyspora phatthalungensis TaxID=664693 RepID=A0A840Q959_9PSEU|nr:hypothetical protein [Saccharopolyspora phatthalungensis]MBB5156467.1 hypothetical protein [Saccharopolyspora phatthalungensis]
MSTARSVSEGGEVVARWGQKVATAPLVITGCWPGIGGSATGAGWVASQRVIVMVVCARRRRTGVSGASLATICSCGRR